MDSKDDKPVVEDHLENDNHQEDWAVGINQKKFLFKVDNIIVQWLGLLYLIREICRLGYLSAITYGLLPALRVSAAQNRTVLSVLFAMYCVSNIPYTICMHRFGASKWISMTFFMSAIAQVMHGVIDNFRELLALRILVGLLQGGILPATLFYMTNWYKRDEIGLRVGIFFGVVTYISAFGGLVAAIVNMLNGKGDKPGWAWVCMIPGLITSMLAVGTYFLLPDRPEKTFFLNEKERVFAVQRLLADGQLSAGDEKFEWRNVRKGLMDYKTWLGVVCMIGFGGAFFGLEQSFNAIIIQLGVEGSAGWVGTRLSALKVPCYFTAGVFTILFGWWADRLQKRGIINLICYAIAFVGYVILISSHKGALSYFATFVAASGFVSGFANTITWIANNMEGAYKRGTSIAVIVTWFNIMGIISIHHLFRGTDGPWFKLGNGVTMGFIAIGVAGNLGMMYFLKQENEYRERGGRDEVIGSAKGGNPSNGCYETEEDARRGKGDEWSGFRYVI